MENHHELNEAIAFDYYGKILHGDFSSELKMKITEYIAALQAFEKTGNPAIPYISAWKEEDKIIWYEFVSKRFIDLMKCKRDEVAAVFKKSIVDRRKYKYPDVESGIRKETIGHRELNSRRENLRAESEKKGVLEAIYKLSLRDGQTIWLKDLATIENHENDRTSISLGCLTVVTKEMKLEEKCENLIEELKNALAEVKTLSGLLPICSSCKKIRDDKGYWNQIEAYISKHSKAEFSHAICPSCTKKIYPELYKENADDIISKISPE